MKQNIRRFISLILAVMLFSLAGCQGTNEDISNSETDDKIQGIGAMYIKDLERPDEIVYVVDGTEKVFSTSDEKFDKILELNAARDTLDTEGVKQESGALNRRMLKLVLDSDFTEKGRYLIYRYADGRYGEVTFYLADSEDVNSGDYSWVIEDGNHGGPFVNLSAADDLIAYLEAE